MLSTDIERARHILIECEFITEFTNKSSFQLFIVDELAKRAISRSLEIIGEASKRLSLDFKESIPDLNWRKIAGTRDKLIHNYEGVDYELIWNILIVEIPKLEKELRIIDELN